MTLILILIALSAFFSAAESALISLSHAKVRTIRSHYLNKLKDKQNRTLIVILVCNTFVNIAAAIYSSYFFGKLYGNAALGYTTGVLTFMILLFGEVLPKSFATGHSKTVGLLVAAPVYYIGIIISPIISIFEAIVKISFKIFSIKKQKLVSDEELIAMVSIGEEEGSLQANEKEIIENVLEFNDIEVREIMTPRVSIDAMHEDYNMKEAAEFMLNRSHTRIPVYRDTIDNIIGFVTYRELLAEFHGEFDTHTTLRQLALRKPLTVSQAFRVHALFKLFNKKQAQMAVVYDDHGKVLGLATMEDLIEEIVGEIVDESDRPEDEIKKISAREFEISGRIHLDQLAEITGLEFEYPEYKTVGFLVHEKLGKHPLKNQKFQIRDWEFGVKRMFKSTVLKIHLKKLTGGL